MADLNTNVRYIKGIGETRAKALEKLGVRTLRDLIGFFPRRYEDRSVIYPIAELPVGETACCRAMIAAVPTSRLHPRRTHGGEGAGGGRNRHAGRDLFQSGVPPEPSPRRQPRVLRQGGGQPPAPPDGESPDGAGRAAPADGPYHAGVSADQGRQPAAAAKGGAAGAGRVPGTAAGRAAGCSAHDPSAVLCQLCL